MTSGKKTKQRRRAAAAAPPPPVRAENARARQASPRVLAIGGAVVALAVIGIVLGVVLSGGGSGTSVGTLPTNGSLANALPGAASVNSLLKGVPQSGLTLGSASAPVTMVEYIDLQCPFCREFETQVMPTVVKRYVRTGKVKVEARVLAFIGPDSVRGRSAMIAAGEQGKAFNFAQILYDNQQTENTGWLDDAMIARAAESIPGLNPRKLFEDRDSSAVAKQADEIESEATSAGVTSTPTIFVGKSGAQPTQVPLANATDQASLVDAIDAALGS
jgi:protein-disulfide isomerase